MKKLLIGQASTGVERLVGSWGGVFLVLMPLLFAACEKPPIPEFDAERAWRHLIVQCEFGPRLPGSAARDSVAAYITRTMSNCGAEVSIQQFGVEDPYSDRTIGLINVIANFYPDRKKRVLLAAHYDSRPWADEETDDSLKTLPVLGANDGASGVAALLELGRLIGVRAPDGIGVDLVFFDGEDYGKPDDLRHYLMGSKYFVSVLPGYRPECGILLDMVAGKESVIAKEGYSRTHASRLTDDLFARAERLGLDFFTAIDGPPIYDDHVPFIQAGIEMVDLFGFEYPHWHTVRDVPENCSPELLGQVGKLVTDFLYEFPF